MIHYVVLMLFNSLFIFGWHWCTMFDLNDCSECKERIINKEIAWWFRKYLGDLLEKVNMLWLTKPLYGCVVCMSSIYGTMFFIGDLFYRHLAFDLLTIPKLIIYCVAVAGLNRLLKNLCQI